MASIDLQLQTLFVKVTGNYTEERLKEISSATGNVNKIYFDTVHDVIYQNGHKYAHSDEDINTLIANSDLATTVSGFETLLEALEDKLGHAADPDAENAEDQVSTGVFKYVDEKVAAADANLEVGEHKDFTAGDTKYTLTIVDGKISLEPYTASSFGACSFKANTITGGTNATKEYDSGSYTLSAKVVAANEISYNINHGTAEIALTGIAARKGSTTSYTYLVGGIATISGGIATISGGIVEGLNYDAADIKGSQLVTGDVAAQNDEPENKVVTDTDSLTASVDKQYAILYYHEKDTDTISSKAISLTTVSKTHKVTFGPGIFTWHSTDGSLMDIPSDATSTGYTSSLGSNLENMVLENLEAGTSIYVAIPSDYTVANFYLNPGSTGKASLPGGFIIQGTTTHYTNNIPYTIYRSTQTQSGLVRYDFE